MSFKISEVNDLDQSGFASLVGPVFEHSPWIAELAWFKIPFSNRTDLHRALCETVNRSGEEARLALIRAHPDLVGHAAQAGTLTRASTGEQASAGLDKLSREEVEIFQKQNNLYQAKFEFPFVICARLNKKEAILEGFKRRLHNSRDLEVKTALEEIFKIAELRLGDLIAD